MRRKFKLTIYVLLTAAIMAVIFYFSSQPGDDSAGLSRTVSEIVALGYNKVLHKGYDAFTLEMLVNTIHPYIRKCAHVTEYMLLAMCVALPMYVYRLRGFALTLIATLLCVVFVASDEYHQTFVPGRSGSPKDVLVDSIGITLACLAVLLYFHFHKKPAD